MIIGHPFFLPSKGTTQLEKAAFGNDAKLARKFFAGLTATVSSKRYLAGRQIPFFYA